ncbi:MAG: MBOAT family O-acyltransferase [Cetobacterium sp.]|uniref:MBOAT family O-acyltransferase n=1 Tax=Cetobacterium sp. TaxID=2071632 RepID=UPI003F3E1E4D
MLFSSLVFLGIFFPVILLIYFNVKQKLRNYVLLVGSLMFYAWGEPRYLSIMLIVIFLNYISGILIEKIEHKKIILWISVGLNLSILFYFKYYNFAVQNFNKLYWDDFPTINVVMPIGISFFIFQGLSYVVDVYRRDVEPQKDIYKLALYISLFPQLIAGPIVKYHDIQKEMSKREDTLENIYDGLKRFSFGLGKKIILANTLGQVADKIFVLDTNLIDFKIAWLGVVAYSLQLYFDFSGYSDMAIGLGKVFGFNFLENFNYPYVSKSITEFWRRWHISLGSWFREYLYIPLGGNRVGKIRNYINLFIVFLATGVWHGANWTFILWGIWHGVFIILEKKINIEKYNKNWQKILRHFYTVIVFIIGWVLFRADNLLHANNFFKVMFGITKNTEVGYNIWYYLDNKVLLILFISILASISVFRFITLENRLKINRLLFNTFSLIILAISMVIISASTYNPFIYFRF